MNDHTGIEASTDEGVNVRKAESNSISEPRTTEKQSGSSSSSAVPGGLKSFSRSGDKDSDRRSPNIQQPTLVVKDGQEQSVPLRESQAFANLDDVDLPTYVQDHATTLTFPEKLMLMLMHAERLTATSGKKPEDLPIGWSDKGQSFVIRNKVDLVSGWLPLFFRQAKFSSFTRKLYRWGFRQVNASGFPVALTQQRNSAERVSFMYFGNEFFRRDDKSLMSSMRSITAAGRRRERGEERVTNATSSEAPYLFQLHSQQRSLLEQQLMSSLSNQSMQRRNAVFTEFGMQQHSSPLLQAAVARAHIQRQHLATQRVIPLHSPQLASSQYLAQFSQLFSQSQPSQLNQQLLAIQQAQSLQQPRYQLPETELQRQEWIRNFYEILLRQMLVRNPAEDIGVPDREPPPPRP